MLGHFANSPFCRAPKRRRKLLYFTKGDNDLIPTGWIPISFKIIQSLPKIKSDIKIRFGIQIMLIVIMLSNVMLNVIMLGVVMLSAIMLSTNKILA